MQKEVRQDPEAEEYQRLMWDALKKSINGLINKVNASNLQPVVLELFRENLLRGRGLLVRAIMRAQEAAVAFTAVYAALIGVVNSKLPQIGELLIARLIKQFQKAFRRDDKGQCLAVTMFLGHLVNQRVAHEIAVLEVLMLLLERPTNDSVEIAVGLLREVGSRLCVACPKPTNAIFDRFRALLQESTLDKRVQYMIEVLFQVRKEGFREYLAIRPELDLVEGDEQITHYITLDDETLDTHEELNVFQYDAKFRENEEYYEKLLEELLPSSDDDVEQTTDEPVVLERSGISGEKVIDATGKSVSELRKLIYLTIMSAVDFEECGHKLLKLDIPIGQEIELCNMIVECCSQERSYLKYYGLLAERFCKLNLVWTELFAESFRMVYATIHRLETNKIRNVGKLFAHLLITGALMAGVMGEVVLSEDETTSAGRILLKFVFQELHEHMGMLELRRWCERNRGEIGGVLPNQAAEERHRRFAYNFFVAIELEPIGKLIIP